MNVQPQPGYFDGLNERLFAAIPPDARNVIEFGCANGLLGAACKNGHPAMRWTGVDLSAAAVAERRPPTAVSSVSR